MSATHVVVDGSNIATEGRSAPSLRQLDDAVRQFQDEFPDSETVVVVDATFGHRIDAAERKAFEDAVAHGELVSPPAGAIGRGDAFVLRIAERVNGQVLSNDSFQEFHADHPWLFDEGRLIGGKPVRGVGWIFTPRRPVRGPRSRSGGEEAARPGAAAASGAAAGVPRARRRGRSAAVLEAVEAAAAEATLAATNVEPAPEGGEDRKPRRARRPRQRGGRRNASGDPTVVAAIEAAKEEAIGTVTSAEDSPARAPKAMGAADSPQAVNDPLTFVRFITEHPLGDEVVGVVSNFVSHGAMVDVGKMHCYVPLSGLGAPPPKSARAVLKKGERRRFLVVRLDPPRRGAQLALAEVPDAQAGAKTARAPRTAKAPQTAKTAKAQKRPGTAAAAARGAKAANGTGPAKPRKAAKSAKAAEPATPASPGKVQGVTKATNAPARSAPVGDNISKTSRRAKGAAKASGTGKSPRDRAKGGQVRASGVAKSTPRQRRDNPHAG